MPDGMTLLGASTDAVPRWLEKLKQWKHPTETLLELGADTTLAVLPPDPESEFGSPLRSPLYHACRCNKPQAIVFLLRHGAHFYSLESRHILDSIKATKWREEASKTTVAGPDTTSKMWIIAESFMVYAQDEFDEAV